MAELSGTIPTAALPMGDLRLLAYLQFMAETAQTDAAKRLFREYFKLERRLFAAGDDPGNR